LLEAGEARPFNEVMLRHTFAAVALAVGVQAHADEAVYPTNQCIAQLHQDERLAPIAGKVALGRSDQAGAAMLELDRPVLAVERDALALWSKLRQFCFDLGAEFRSRLPSAEQAALAARLFGLHQRMVGELREGRSTFAEFNRRRLEVYLIAAALEAQLLGSEHASAPQSPARPAGHTDL
jgi:hypothetical protein